MTQYIQDDLPGMAEYFAKEQQKEVGTEATQMHLVRQFVKYGKYQKFSKDPEFQKRCELSRQLLIKMMGRVGR